MTDLRYQAFAQTHLPGETGAILDRHPTKPASTLAEVVYSAPSVKDARALAILLNERPGRLDAIRQDLA